MGLALSSVLVGCGGGHAGPDSGDGHIDVDGGDVGPDGKDGGNGTAIVVDTPSGMTATESQDGYCDILEAAAAAGSGASVGDCANPKGVTRIELTPGNTYPVRKTLRLASATEIGIPDGATGTATITAAAAFDGGAAPACLVSVSDAGKPPVWLRDVTLTPGAGSMLTGACVTRGSVGLRRVRVTGFDTGGVVATCLPASGCDHEADSEAATTLRVFSSLIDGNHSASKGAGIASEGSGTAVVIAHSAIVDNASDNDGGGVYLGGGWGTDIIQSSTISGNTSNGVGGGVLVRFAEGTWTYLNLLNSTIANNTSTGTGGGIEFEQAHVGMQDVSVYSSIVAGNFSTSTLEWNINASWSMPAAPGEQQGVFNCVQASLIYVAPGFPQPTDSGGCVFNVRNPFLGPLQPLGGEANLPLHPLLAGGPTIDKAVNDTTPDEQRDPWISDFDPGTPVDWTMFDRVVDGDGDGTAVRDLGAYERSERWQAELLAVRARGTASPTVVTIPDGYDRGAGIVIPAASATGEFVTYALPIGEAGLYDMAVRVHSAGDAGKFQIAIADNAAGPWTAVGAEQDGYTTGSAFASLGPFATPLFTSPGEKLVRFTVTGHNTASTGYKLFLDYIEAKKRANACPIAAVAAGGNSTCALLANKGVRCWGADAQGQLGDGGGPDRASPPAADVATDVAGIALGAAHTCILSTGGEVRCWGANANGQLGDGTTTARATPPGTAVLSGVKAIAAGRSYTCALMTGGGVRCWGANESGQLGDGTTADRPRPPATDVLAGVQAIATGGAHTCALMTTGGVRCWGANGQGQLGDGTTANRPTPPSADVATGMAAVSAGDIHTCGLTTPGGVRCWGHNLDAELGLGNYDTVITPPSTDVLTGVKQVVAANLFTCAMLTTGGVRCWGLNSHGEIGDDTEIQVDRRAPATVDILGGAASLAGGFTHVCARMTSGGLRCWGGNDAGQLGDGMRPINALTPPTMDGPGFTGTCP
jgi:alpha-tubulin suppressor-like RCC1 family protein